MPAPNLSALRAIVLPALCAGAVATGCGPASDANALPQPAPSPAVSVASTVGPVHVFPRDLLVPPASRVSALALPAARPTEAESLATRLGLEHLLVSGFTWKVTSRLNRGTLIWYDPAIDHEYGRVPAHGVLPLLDGKVEPTCRLPETGRWIDRGGQPMPQPGGATRLARVTALVEDVARPGCDALAFGPTFEVPELGARARDAVLGGTTVRVLAPASRDGVVARLLATGGSRWIGGALAVRDLGATLALLRRHGVTASRARDGTPRVWIAPAQAGGALIEFEQDPGTPPRGSRAARTPRHATGSEPRTR